MKTERRGSPRYDLMAQIRVKKGRVNYIMDVTNVSTSGAFITTDAHKSMPWFRVGQELQLNLFTIEPVGHQIIVQCSSPQTGDEARAACAVACDACGRCALDAPEGVIEMKGGLPVLGEPRAAPEACTYRCPTGAIRWVQGEQLQEQSRVHLPVLRSAHG